MQNHHFVVGRMCPVVLITVLQIDLVTITDHPKPFLFFLDSFQHVRSVIPFDGFLLIFLYASPNKAANVAQLQPTIKLLTCSALKCF